MAPVLSHGELSDDCRLRSLRAATARRDLFSDPRIHLRLDPADGARRSDRIPGFFARSIRKEGPGERHCGAKDRSDLRPVMAMRFEQRRGQLQGCARLLDGHACASG